MTLRLEAAGVAPLTLDNSTGIIVQQFDLGWPTVREVIDHRVDADGADDRTAHFGPRVVSLAATIVPTGSSSRRDLLDRLRQFCHPGRRAYLYVAEEGGSERRLRLRASDQSAPLEVPTMRTVQVAWVAPDGVQEAAELTALNLPAAAESVDGLAFPIGPFPIVWPSAPVEGGATAVNAGNVDVEPVIRIYGPAENPRIENRTTDLRLVFNNLSLAVGEYVEINVRDRTIRLNGLAEQSRYDRLDIAASSWWVLVPGVNEVRFYPELSAAPSTAQLYFRSAWL